MARATLESRLPMIMAELRPRVSAAMRMGAEEIASTARMRVPVESGDLRDSIEVRPSGAAQWKVNAGNKEAFYAGMVEFGTARRAATPYLVPAAEQGQDHVVELVAVVLRSL
jgi:HK97 gp10 family phage protein